MHQGDVDKMLQAICDEKDLQPRYKDDKSQRWQTNDRVNNEAERIRNEIQPVWQELDDTGEALRLRAIALKDRTKKGKIYDKAEKIRDTIADDKVKLSRLSDGILRGANNPKLRARMQKGDDMHNSYQNSSSNCTASEVEIDGGRGRIDCVRVNSNGTCSVIEIKSNGKGGRAAGEEQLQGRRNFLKDADGKKLLGETKGKVWEACMDTSDDDHWRAKVSEYLLVTYDFCPIGNESFNDPFPVLDEK